jgi:2-keto-4-pentenoate hydratase/2-oxohepta-3-ene-1,7-dioic acid hydratase in catechol pathway
MRICRFNDDRVGIVENDIVKDVTEAVSQKLPPLKWPVPQGDVFIANLPSLLPVMRDAAKSARAIPLKDVKLLSPVANPPRVIAAPLNYKLHVEESANPAINHGVHMPTHEGFATPIDKYGLFLKSQTGLIGPSQDVVLQWSGRRNDHEVELGIVIGKGGKNISRDDALNHVAGYAIALDMVVRGPEDRSFRKSADTYSVLGPWLVTPDEIPDPDALEFGIEVDGEVRQRSNTRDLICDCRDLIVRASDVYSLYPGDIIMTGTPDGVSEVKSGNVMHAWIEKIGEMNVKCV